MEIHLRESGESNIEDTLYVISGNIIEAYDMNTGVKSGDIIL